MHFCYAFRPRLASALTLFVSAVWVVLMQAGTPRDAHAQAVVPNALAAMEGSWASATLDGDSARTYQTQIAASQLTAFATGSQILGLSFRLSGGQNAPAADLTFASYQVTLSGAAKTINNLSTTFASNIGANAVTVYNNALTFKASSYSSGATSPTPNAFGPTINFSSGYTYQGGDLVITIRHSGNGVAFPPLLDSTSSASQGYGTAIVGQYSTAGQTATTATNTGVATVLRLNNTIIPTDTPEPATLPLLGAGVVSLAGFMRRNRFRHALSRQSARR